MARTIVPAIKVGRDALTTLGTIAVPAGSVTPIDQANGNYVKPKRSHKLVLLVYNSKAGATLLTIRAGAYPPAEEAGVGDLALSLPTVSFVLITGLSGARFLQKDGTINIDTDAGATGSIWAYEMPA